MNSTFVGTIHSKIMSNQPDRAKIIAPPPLLAVVCIGLAFLARHFNRLAIFHSGGALRIALGVICFVGAVTIVFIARRQMVAIGTHPNPYRPTMAITTTGLYRFSRNPIYIAFLLVLIAFAFWGNSWWFVVADALLFFLLQVGVVRREESYLSEKFGDTYLAYCTQVRRWI